MGVVYHAIDPNIGRPVAIKTIQLGGIRKPDEQERLRERLFREARSAGILSHPGIVTIYDVEQQGEVAYIAMEYVDGPTLDQLLSDPQPLAPKRILGILLQTAAALDYAHAKGIVHRDIKPANIMIAGDGSSKITDFGIAKITASEQFTMTGSIVGTPHYMSPEQVQGQPVDGRSDQFSLAVIAYEMLTGEKPYTGEHLTTVVYKIVAEEPMAPHRVNSTLGGAIDGVLRKGLAKRPDGRYKTCSEFIEALDKACAGVKNWKPMPRGGSLNEPTIADAPAAATTIPAARRPARSGGTTTIERTEKRQSGFLPFLLAILMAAALLALIGWQAGPWKSNGAQTAQNNDQSDQAKSQPSAASGTAAPAAQPTASSGPVNPPSDKPSPLSGAPGDSHPHDDPADKSTPEDMPKPPAVALAAEPNSKKEASANAPAHSSGTPRASQPTAQSVMLVTSPGGATVTVDRHPDQTCKTPCELQVLPGRYSLAFTLPGYQIEHRDIDVGMAAFELPAVVLRSQGGVLMLSSSPPGATILVNGKTVTEVTPARLTLPPGDYTITVEKNGLRSENKIPIKNGDTRLLKVNLGQ